jgi:hypothetical protein
VANAGARRLLVLGSRLPPVPPLLLLPPPQLPRAEPPIEASTPVAGAGAATGDLARSSGLAAEEGPLPFGGDLQAAMRAQDRSAIKAIMAHNKAKTSRGEGGVGGGGGGGSIGGGGSSSITATTTTSSSASVAVNRGAGATALVRGVGRLLAAQPHRDCAAEAFMLRTRRSVGRAAAEEEEEAVFVFQPPPPGAATLADWLSSTVSVGGGGGSAALCRRQGAAGFEALRGLLRGLLTDLQLLHGNDRRVTAVLEGEFF